MKGRVFFLIAIDCILVNVAFWLGLIIRYGGQIPPGIYEAYNSLVWPLMLIWIGSFYGFKLYQKMWGYASIREMVNLIRAVTVGIILVGVLNFFVFLYSEHYLPFSVLALLWLLNILLIGGSRFAWRVYRDSGLSKNTDQGQVRIPVLLAGAGDAGAVVARELKYYDSGGLRAVGFIDRDKSKHGLTLFEIPVLGDRNDIPWLVQKYGIQQVILTMPSASTEDIKEIMEICHRTKVKVRTLPRVYDLIDGKVSIKDLRDIEVEDILGREPVSVDLDGMAKYLRNQVVLVTGAGGSIGSELCRQIAVFKPRQLLLLDNYENSVYEVQLELRQKHPGLNLEVQILDIKDKRALWRFIKRVKPGVVFHAAAHKHVPLMESNAVAAVKNNVTGTKNLVEASAHYGVNVFIFISTDKAVNPSSVMGASKRLAEIIVQHYNFLSDTRFAAVRFGNVLGSNGSVIPIFRQQIALGGPVTVTSPEMTRYFMTISEAVQLVIQAGTMAEGGEIFLLDMGAPVKILDLAETIIKLSGFEPYKDIDIVFSGIRPGEKLYEELLTEKEGVNMTRHERIFVSSFEDYSIANLEPLLAKLTTSDFPGDEFEAIQVLENMVPGYKKNGYGAEGRLA